MKKFLIILLALIVIAFPIILTIIQYEPERRALKEQQNQHEQQEQPDKENDSKLPTGEVTIDDKPIYGTDVPLQGNDATDKVDTRNLIKLDDGKISDYNLEEVASMFKGKDLYYDTENIGEHALFIAHVTNEIEVEDSDKEKFIAMLQHSTKNLKVLAVKVDNEWVPAVQNKDSEEFIKFADDRAYDLFDISESFIVNYNSVFLEVQQMALLDGNENIIIVGGEIIVA